MRRGSPEVGARYREADGEAIHEIVGITDDGEVDVVEYEDGEKTGEYTAAVETFLADMEEQV